MLNYSVAELRILEHEAKLYPENERFSKEELEKIIVL